MKRLLSANLDSFGRRCFDWSRCPTVSEDRRRNGAFIVTCLIIVALAASLRGFDLGGKSLWVDEIITASLSMRGFTEAVEFAWNDVTPPLSYLWTSIAMSFGRDEAIVRFPSFVLGILGVASIFWLGRLTVGGKVAGLVAAGLLAVSPFHIFHSQDARMYSALILFSTLAYCCELAFWKASDKSSQQKQVIPKNLWLAAWVCATVLNLYTSYFALFVLAGQGLHVSYRLWENRRLEGFGKLALGWGIAALFTCILYTPWTPALIHLVQKERGFEEAFPVEPVKVILEAIHQFGPQSFPGSVLFALLAVIGLTRSLSLNIFVLTQIVFPVVYLFGFESSHFFVPRYLSFLLPVYLVVVAAGMFQLAKWARPAFVKRPASGPIVFVIFFAVIIGVTVPALVEYYRGEKQNWRDAVAFVASKLQPGDRVLAGKNRAELAVTYYLLDHPLPVNVHVHGSGMNEEELFDRLQTSGRTWFIHSWRPSTSRKLLVILQTEFDSMGSFEGIQPWAEVYVYLRRPNPS